MFSDKYFLGVCIFQVFELNQIFLSLKCATIDVSSKIVFSSYSYHVLSFNNHP